MHEVIKWIVIVRNVVQGYEYSRSGNPTRNCTEKCIAALENGKHGALIHKLMFLVFIMQCYAECGYATVCRLSVCL